MNEHERKMSDALAALSFILFMAFVCGTCILSVLGE